MGSEYDRKFEEMKKYIPFLENMIKRLESNSSSANPRQAQLDKIRSLRDLLLDKKKRMKMDNLLKCEQVLVNLYAKVEKRDVALPLSDNMESRASIDSPDLETVRNKLKNVAKIQNVTETLPEIARASEREEICEPGSKEPALFQRRPHKLMSSPTKSSPNKLHETHISSKSHSKRSYTRVLVSPEPRTSRCWSGEGSDDTSKEKPLFSRRSPIRSPRKSSPSYYKKERKKTSREKKTSKDLNITLKVPEESLHSLNTEDILSRIITCSDGDVDIDTLRELRSQILGELKQTGTNDDISELILKSYNKKPKPRRRRKHEVEEGEISDSESEAIENIYGSLVVMDKDKKSGQVKTSVDKSNQQRKIQICLVINSDKEGDNKPDNDLSESGVFENKSQGVICLDSDTSPSPRKEKDKEAKQNRTQKQSDVFSAKEGKQDNIENISTTAENETNDPTKPTAAPTLDEEASTEPCENDSISTTENTESGVEITRSPVKSVDVTIKTHEIDSGLGSNDNLKSPVQLNVMSKDKPNEPSKNIANFYKPLLGDENVEKTQSETLKITERTQKIENDIENPAFVSTKDSCSSEDNNKTDESTKIPLLHEPTLPPKAKKDVLSEIDILQALKNEILSETIPLASAEAETPALHQPKITKVASAVEASTSNLTQTKMIKVANSNQMPKKRISIENYKKKSETAAKSLFIKKRSREEMNKKQSLKLTEKECERFNFPARLSLDEDTDDISDTDLLDDADDAFSLNDIYGDLAPKSPDQDNFSDAGIDETPVIIPAHPVKSDVSCKSDIDMRNVPPQPVTSQLVPLVPSQAIQPQPAPSPSSFSKVATPTPIHDTLKNNNMKFESNKIVSNQIPEGKRTSLIDPRLRRDLTPSTSKDSPNPYGTTTFEGTPKSTQFPNIPQLMALSMTPVYTPSYTPSMTPIRTPNTRSYEMTPTHQSFEVDEPKQKHVYAPLFSVGDTSERDFPVTNDVHWETNCLSNTGEDRRPSRDGRNSRWESGSSGSRESQTNYNPRNDKYYIDRRDGYRKSDCPPTPGPSFGWTDSPGTPRNSFRDAPMTPSHPFGRSDCPSTPSHPFGRSDGPPTPNHPFGRNECPGTPIHHFGRTDNKDPRLKRRQSEFEYRAQHDEKDSVYQNDRNYNRDGIYKSHGNYGRADLSRNYDREQLGKSDRYLDEHGSRYANNTTYDSQRRFDREQSIGRNNKHYPSESSGRGFDRARRENSLNRSSSRDDDNYLFTRNRDVRYDNRNSSNFDETDTRRNQREKSIGRTIPGESVRASSRAQSVGRNVVKEMEYGNTLPGKSQVRSLTSDTNVNATFQNLIESGKGIQVFDYTFDARRQRASSVGRSLAREGSINRTLTREAKPTHSQSFQRRSNFERASSVGRTLVQNVKDKTFQEIKADFEAYRLQSSKTKIASKVSLGDKNKEDKLESNSRSSKYHIENESRNSKQNAKQVAYLPRKNYRDPRMRREQKEKDKERNRNDRSSSYSRDHRHSGIVYSSDNIAKGTIMGSGFGVKNYKIPKIKRPDPEPEDTKKESAESINIANKVTIASKTDPERNISVEKRNENNNENISDISKEIAPKTESIKKNKIEKLKETKNMGNNEDDTVSKNKLSIKEKSAINLEEDLDKRVTRSNRKSGSFKYVEPSKRKKRIRKIVIDDSDSEVDNEKAESEVNTENEKKNTKTKEVSNKGLRSPIKLKPVDESEGPTSDKELKKTLEEDSLDSSFAIDDLEIFSGNASDPVIDNINDLIANLDHDLGAKSGNDSFTDEIEKMMGAIDSQEENTLGDISELIEKDLNESNEQLKHNLAKDDAKVLSHELELVTGPQNLVESNFVPVADKEQESQKSVKYISNESISATVPKQVPETHNIETFCEEKNINSSVELKASNDEIVSTTQVEESLSNSNKKTNEIGEADKVDQTVQITDLPTPDSTIAKKVQSHKSEESLPDSTMEIHSEISSDVTSTRDVEKSKKESVESSSRKEVSAMESFGSLLSILQDKSKIKELLSMLGDQSGDSEKIKKKLEKLSEIVSDEEDTKDDLSKDNEKQSYKSPTAHRSNALLEPTVTQNKIAETDKESKFEQIGSETSDDIVKNTHETYPSEILKANQENKKSVDYVEIESSQATVMEETHVKIVKSKDLSQSNDQSKDHNVNDQTDDDPSNDNPNEELESNQDEESNDLTQKIGPKKIRRGKGRGKKSKFNKSKPVYKVNEQRTQKPKTQKTKKMSRELQTLHEDIKEMFMSDDILNATGIRMCRLAKMVDKKRAKDSSPIDSEPTVLLKKYKGTEHPCEPEKKIRKKPGPKPKARIVNEPSVAQKDKKIDTDNKNEKPKDAHTYKPGPKSKTKQKRDRMDPYEFESDSVADTNTTKESDANSSNSDTDSSSSEISFGSSEVLADIKKKPKKKRGSWQTGFIKPRQKKKKDLDLSNDSLNTSISPLLPRKPVTIPDINCFTDKTYCFQRGIYAYDCRLCHYSGTEIVNHYKKQHTHTEVPLSRMDPDTARKAIQQCEEINFQAISKIPSEKYTCRFCYKEFSKNRVALETFFWHVVSTHTGEYKHLCYECVNVTRCPFNLDIPPPPKDVKGQLIGYICGKCNFTQISLENLKTHVIVRHNDEQTEVYTINLGVMTNKAMKSMLRKSVGEEQKPRTLRSSRSNQSTIAASDDHSEITSSDRISEIGSAIGSIAPKIEEPDPQMGGALQEVKKRVKPGPIKSKLRFEADDQERSDETIVKLEQENGAENRIEPTQFSDTYNEPTDHSYNENSELDQTDNETVQLDQSYNERSFVNHTRSLVDQSNIREQNLTLDTALQSRSEIPDPRGSTDIFEQPHFKLHYKENGSKEYVCCINGEVHYRTTLLISLKKHVQTKHHDIWDGYCCVCKVIVTLQGVKSSFRDCLMHFLDKHIDDIPLMENIIGNTNEDSTSSLRSSVEASTIERTESPRSYIVVRPLADMIAKDVTDDDPPMFDDNELQFPKIENVVSLGEKTVEAPHASPVYPMTSTESVARPVPFQYEEVQAEVMSKKHRIVLDTMMPKEMLVRVFKCAGRFCSFTSDSAEDALVHASAHKQMGGEGALDCAYCNFDAADNAIDLVMHVFKVHGRCQYSCILCFYRAAADQLVGAHFLKAHGGTGKAAKVLRTTTLLASTGSDSSNMLSRETAVPYYICSHGEGGCRYRTYTPGKFCEHMQQKHGSEESHPCNMCKEKLPTPAELVKHLKSHGVKLYQCTWCVHGADTESEMLSHAATAHPTKNPQAYMRIITNKDGSTDLRVLPLVYLNKLKVPIEDVIPSKVKENPTKEAERSIELEKLIIQTTQLTEATTGNATPNLISEDPEVNEVPDQIIAQTSDLTDAVTNKATDSLVSSREKNQMEMSAISASSVVKNEPEDQPHTLNVRTEVVYCLDSDEEETATQISVAENNSSKQDVIDLSDDGPSVKTTQENSVLKQLICSSQPVIQPEKTSNESKTPSFIKLSQNHLFKCPECQLTFLKILGLRKHAMSCCRNTLTFRCPHTPCSLVLANISQLINHYSKDHSMPKNQSGKDHNMTTDAKVYHCGLCKCNSTTMRTMKKHVKEIHNVHKVIISSKIEENGTCAFTLHRSGEVAREMPKRKTSIETPKKYGIEDIDKLPINPILDSLVYCNICEFSTKVRLNMVRHLQLHAERQPVPQTAPVNPVPHLETNEMHFDKMVNLASSSAAFRAEKLANSTSITPEAASRYPKYVPERQRHTCGAKGCSYISVDEEMLRCHWETLHSGTTDYHCVHCPPHQQLNTTQTLTAPRILAHLKMHNVSLYACSSCSYYHYKRQVVEKHIGDIHKTGQVKVVREEGNLVCTQPAAAPTMDLKPWQCGLCIFKSMLRPEVVEHCSKIHQTKMQYKCAYCPFRTSTLENITKHQANSHATRPRDVFYYYYREGTVPDEADGTPRWQKQRHAYLALTQPVKTEPEPDAPPVQPPSTARVPIDLNLVKKEVNYSSDADLNVEDLCKQFGEFCDPNGIKFKCPLCKTVTEHTRDSMLSHLYEELKYRRWSCGLCSYKAYHRAGLNEHMASEHRNIFAEPSQLPISVNIEKWVSKLLDHQLAIIDKNKENFARQKIIMDTPTPVAGPSKAVAEPPKPVLLSSDSELEQAFGPLGTSKNNSFCCPKCNFLVNNEEDMRNHMESELTKIRWCCTKCSEKFQTYHEAQFHCKSHSGLAARPKEAIRDPSLRAAWVSAVIKSQKQSMKPNATQNASESNIDKTDFSENSLLVVRYEEAAPNDLLKEIPRKRPIDPDSEDDSLVICEPEIKKRNDRNCPFCAYTSVHKHILKEHVLKHYNLKLMTCAHCDFNGTRKAMHIHLDTEHPHLPHLSKQTEIPNCLPSEYMKKSNQKTDDDKPKLVCLHCETSVNKDALHTHTHDGKPAEFGEKGQLVVKCCICFALRLNLESMQSHYKEVHPDIENTNYAYYKLQIDVREVHACGICSRRFTFIRDLRIHHSAMHNSFHLSFKTVPYRHDEDSYETRGKRKLDMPNLPAKRVAKKSTSKLPKTSSVAKKSTTKLPNTVVESDSEDEYSYYGTKPSPFEQFENVKTMMPMYNTMVEIDVKKLSGILKIEPKVIVKDCKKNQ